MKSAKLIWDSLSFTNNGSSKSKAISFFIVALIILNVTAVILGTFETIQNKYSSFLNLFETISVIIFSIEYFTRILYCVNDDKYKTPMGRLKYLKSPLAVIDLIAILPFYLCFVNIDMRFIRIFRLVRVLRLLKLSRYSKALELIVRAIKSVKEELSISLGLVLILLFLSSCILYHFEHEVQPLKFANILSSMWCIFTTFTFIGNGDIYPITNIGRSLLAISAFLNLAIFGLPAALITSAFIEESKTKKDKTMCPYCEKKCLMAKLKENEQANIVKL